MPTDGIAPGGTMIVVVGPSGAGKDSVIGFALQQLAERQDVAVVRRMITRNGDAGGEDHDAISVADFERLQAQGAFAVCWQAHGLRYGIPADCLEHLATGRTLIANGSRAVLPTFRQVFANRLVVNIVATPEVLAHRLVSRGRESEADILKRLQRRTPNVLDDPDVVTIDNSGPLDVAGRRFAAIVEQVSRRSGNG